MSVKRRVRSSGSWKKVFLFLLVPMVVILSGCVSQPPVSDGVDIPVTPVVDYYPLEGYTEQAGELFLVLKGTIPDVQESLRGIVVDKTEQPSTFSVDDELNFVVFRGVFNTGGYEIGIDRMERQEHEFIVHGIYTDPGEGMMVTQAFTQPTVIIPVGRLERGEYSALLRVTKVVQDAAGKKVVEAEKVAKNVTFRVE